MLRFLSVVTVKAVELLKMLSSFTSYALNPRALRPDARDKLSKKETLPISLRLPTSLVMSSTSALLPLYLLVNPETLHRLHRGLPSSYLTLRSFHSPHLMRDFLCDFTCLLFVALILRIGWLSAMRLPVVNVHTCHNYSKSVDRKSRRCRTEPTLVRPQIPTP